MMEKLVLFLVFLQISDILTYNPLIRRTKYGIVRGTLEYSAVDSSIQYFSFMGVPYAHPPVGNLRFQEPAFPKRWSGVRETNRQSMRCVQFSNNFDGPDVIGQEDCLYLNVFVPKKFENGTLMPVMFWIHGGNFIFGSNANAGPDYLMENAVVMVSIQYRLNVFGFLSTLDRHASGNFGLKDQVMALKWVKDNIRVFGGDPNRVTIIGESAGGASVQYHMLSDKSKGLFHRAISHSGSTLSRWAHQQYPRQMVIRLANGLGFRNVDSKELITKLQSIDYKTILKTAFNTSIMGFFTPYYSQPFSTTIETESEKAYISRSSFEILKNGTFSKVPYILGYNTEEGSFGYTYIHNGRANIDRYVNHSEYLVSPSFNISDASMCNQEVAKQIQEFYFRNGPLNNKANWIKFMSQELFVRSIRKSLELMYLHTPTYFYRFSYRGSRNESYMGGVGHHEELMYLWYSRSSTANRNETREDEITRKRFVTLWVNFATTGNPTPRKDALLQNLVWPQVKTSERIPFLDIGKNLVVGFNPDEKDYIFWEKQFGLCGNPPYESY